MEGRKTGANKGRESTATALPGQLYDPELQLGLVGLHHIKQQK